MMSAQTRIHRASHGRVKTQFNTSVSKQPPTNEASPSACLLLSSRLPSSTRSQLEAANLVKRRRAITSLLEPGDGGGSGGAHWRSSTHFTSPNQVFLMFLWAGVRQSGAKRGGAVPQGRGGVVGRSGHETRWGNVDPG